MQEQDGYIILDRSDMFHYGGDNKGFFVAKYNTCEKSAPPHAHTFIQINYVNSGKALHVINNKEFPISKGDIFIVPLMVEHYIKGTEDDVAEIIEFECLPDFLDQKIESLASSLAICNFEYIKPFIFDDKMMKPRFSLSGATQIEVENILKEALDEMEQKKNGYETIIYSLFIKLLVIIVREFDVSLLENLEVSQNIDKKEAILKAVNYINSHFHEDLQATDVAKKILMSPTYFHKYFKHFTSQTFKDYLVSVRLSQARDLLKFTDNKIINIASLVGFANVTHFNRTFKAYFNMTPSQYRKINRKSSY